MQYERIVRKDKMKQRIVPALHSLLLESSALVNEYIPHRDNPLHTHTQLTSEEKSELGDALGKTDNERDNDYDVIL